MYLLIANYSFNTLYNLYMCFLKYELKKNNSLFFCAGRKCDYLKIFEKPKGPFCSSQSYILMGCTISLWVRIAFGYPRSKVKSLPRTGPKQEIYRSTCNGSRHTMFDRPLRIMDHYILMGCTMFLGSRISLNASSSS
jgi:hypothetical protein